MAGQSEAGQSEADMYVYLLQTLRMCIPFYLCHSAREDQSPQCANMYAIWHCPT